MGRQVLSYTACHCLFNREVEENKKHPRKSEIGGKRLRRALYESYEI